MSLIRPLGIEIPRRLVELPTGWQQRFQYVDLGNISIDVEALWHLENWLRCYVDMTHIASFSAQLKEVVRALRRIESRAV